jgi:chorismate lyase/3-hydroxybenzoate synthase
MPGHPKRDPHRLVTNYSRSPAPRIDFLHLEDGLPADALLAIGFGAQAPLGPRRLRVPLEPLRGAGLTELWRANGEVRTGEDGLIHFSCDEHFLAGWIEIEEQGAGGIVGTTEAAYRAIADFQRRSGFPHLLRTWNHLDAINDGPGDAERYRGFCQGRVAGLAGLPVADHPAATVIGRRDGVRVLQVYWLAGRAAGLALENPRQTSAYRYPREYGGTPPTFSRAMLLPPEAMLISGTASIVGHASRHPGDARAQLQEIFSNLDSLIARARETCPGLPTRFGGATRLKVYLRRAEDLAMLESSLRSRLPPALPLLVLQGDVCRADLLVEIDGSHMP